MSDNVWVIGKLKVAAEDRAEWLDAANDLVEATREEPGVLDYAIGADLVDPTCIVFYERYESPAALRSHVESEHFRAFVEKAKDIPIIEGPDSVKCLEGEPFDSGPNALKEASS